MTRALPGPRRRSMRAQAMQGLGQFEDLRRRLVRKAGDRVLATSIANLGEALDDSLVVNLLIEFGQRCQAKTLAELLERGDELTAPPAAESVLWRQLEAALMRWAAGSRHRFSRHRGTAVAAGVSEPPEALAAIRRWAQEHDVVDMLTEPASRVLPWTRALPLREEELEGLTVASCLEAAPVGGRRRPGAASELRAAARAYLWHGAGRRRVQRERERRWRRRLDQPMLDAVSLELRRQLRRVLSSPGAEAPVVFSEAPLRVRRDPPAVEVRFVARAASERDVVATLSLAEAEKGRLGLHCTCSGGHGVGCGHRRVLLEWTLDILHDASDPQHVVLCDVAGRPAWRRFVDALAKARREARDMSSEREVAFRVGGQGRGVVVRAVTRGRRASGKATRGRLIDAIGALEVVGDGASPRDRLALAALAAMEGARDAEAVRGLTALVLENLVGHPRVFSIDDPTAAIQVVKVRPVVRLAPSGGDGSMALTLRIGEETLAAGEVGAVRLDAKHLVAVDEARGRASFAALDRDTAALLDLMSRAPAPEIPLAGQSAVVDALVPLQPGIELELPDELRGELRPADDGLVARLMPLPGGGLEVSLRVRPLRGLEASWPAAAGPVEVYGRDDGRPVRARRDFDREACAAEALARRLGLEAGAGAGDERFCWRLEAREAALDLLAGLREVGDAVALEWPAGGRPWQVSRIAASSLRVRVSRAADWFGIDGEARVGDDGISLATLLAAARADERWISLGEGRFARIEESLRERLAAADRVIVERGDDGALVLGPAHVEAAQDLLAELGECHVDEAFVEMRRRIVEATELCAEIPDDLEATLRSYQVEGFRWLARLAHWGVGGCLADDMGLGKTIQTLAVLLRRAQEGPALVVAPTSVESGWIAETERVAPSLRTIRYRGPGRRALLRGLGPRDLVITSYDLMALDIERLEEHRFSTVVFDEAQAIKNPRTRRARAANRIRADFRVALTGTPLENHLGELWSLFRAINPGLLGPWEHFASRFAVPIERDGDLERREALAKLLRPFLLRRMKAEVAPELPERTEVVVPIELSDEERALYERTRSAALAALAARGSEPEARQRVAVLAAITRLRQLACHPRLLDRDTSVPSSKLFVALELIERLLGAGQRALVFSQFTKHLSLLREALDYRRVEYLYLDGRTPAGKREELVSRWREEGSALFLISLKAGGVGLNLTGADAVIHLDPWWNPAVEDQASDRAHRIGQERPLTVVRLIAQGTIEEAVISLHERKRGLARSLLDGASEAGAVKLEELRELMLWGGDAGLDDDPDDVEAPPGPPTPVFTPAGLEEPEEPAEPVKRRRPPTRRSAASPAASPVPAPRWKPVGASVHLPADLASMVEAFVAGLEDEHRRGLIRTATTIAVYRRTLERFTRFVEATRTDGDAALPLDEWGRRYVAALAAGAFEAPTSEATILRTVLRRLEAALVAG